MIKYSIYNNVSYLYLFVVGCSKYASGTAVAGKLFLNVQTHIKSDSVSYLIILILK